MKLVFATHNTHKLQEIADIMPSGIQLLSLYDIGCTKEIKETGDTLTENSFIKASFIYNQYKHNCFADDTGLEVVALGGAPGVYSARYSGEKATYQNNVDKLLSQMQDCVDRKARFRTVITLILDGKQYLFEGIVEGHITVAQIGEGGFGYDSVFVPKGYDRTFAQMSMEEKSTISHRGIAIEKMIDFIEKEILTTV